MPKTNEENKIVKTLNLSLVLILSLLLLTGCGGKSVNKDKSSQVLSSEEVFNADYWFNLAANSQGFVKTDYYLNGIQALINAQQNLQAHQVLEDIFEYPLSELNTHRWRLYKTITSSNIENFEAALKQYAFLRNLESSVLSLEDKKLLLKGHAQAYAFAGNFVEALNKRIELSAIIEESQQQLNNDEIWAMLQLPTTEYLRIFDENPSSDRVIQGWINLALINKQHTGHPRELMQALSIWRDRFSSHPAHKLMPSAIAELSQAKLIEPQNIAILIPQTGKLATVGKIIRKGIEASYLSQNLVSKNKPKLRFYDSNVDDIISLYQLAQQEGAEFVVGPLNKAAINKLLDFDGLSTPILVLNMLDKELSADITAYQFGLPIENEARQVAEKLWQLNINSAAALVPDTNTGDRALNAFKEQFERLNGEVVVQRHYQNGKDYSKVIRSLLGVDSSTQRYQKLKKILGQPIQYEERRRKDIDGIFLFTGVDEGRRLKPLLDYYYAQDIPVFSTSSIFQGNRTDIKNKDLENISFLSIPWLLDDSNDENLKHDSLKEFWPDTVTGKNAHFFAFGFDAYQLINQLAVLEVFPLQYLEGKTGRLYLSSKKQMARDLPWVNFRKGKIKWQGYLDDITQASQ